MPGVGKRRVGGNSKCKKTHKQQLRGKFVARHIDQVWQDVRKAEGVHTVKAGPLGTTDRVALDEDLPACGKHYCTPCSRYFASGVALADHEKTKPHKRRIKALQGAAPHNQADADWAGGLGPADNGAPLRAAAAMEL